MINTTTAAIRLAIETLIEGLTPSGGATGETAYAKIPEDSYEEDFDDISESAIDRRYAIQGFIPQEMSIHGTIGSSVFTSHFELVIGHVLNNYGTSQDRREKDIHQLIAQITRNENRPSGVHRIYYVSGDIQIIRGDMFAWSTLTFAVVHAQAADYGGT